MLRNIKNLREFKLITQKTYLLKIKYESIFKAIGEAVTQLTYRQQRHLPGPAVENSLCSSAIMSASNSKRTFEIGSVVSEPIQYKQTNIPVPPYNIRVYTSREGNTI